MNDDLRPLEHRLNALIAKLSPSQQRRLARQLALDLRRSNRQRIEANVQPDGTAMTPRRRPRFNAQRSNKRLSERARLRSQRMFPKMAKANSLKFKVSADQASLFFSGRRGRMALNSVAARHHFGAKALPKRPLLGFSQSDLQQVEATIVDFLSQT